MSSLDKIVCTLFLLLFPVKCRYKPGYNARDNHSVTLKCAKRTAEWLGTLGREEQVILQPPPMEENGQGPDVLMPQTSSSRWAGGAGADSSCRSNVSLDLCAVPKQMITCYWKTGIGPGSSEHSSYNKIIKHPSKHELGESQAEFKNK